MNKEGNEQGSEPVKRLRQVWGDYSLGCAKREQADRILLLGIVTIILIGLAIVLALTSVAGGQTSPLEPNVPFTYDANDCAGPVMDWGICEPHVTIFYNLRFYTQSGRPAQGLSVTLGGGPAIDPLIHYYGQKKNPTGPGWFHEWTFAYTPETEGVHHLNCTASYGPRSHTPAWLIPAGPKETDTRTVLLNAVAGDVPFLTPGVTPTPVSSLSRVSHLYQVAKKQGWSISGGMGRDLPRLLGKTK